MDRKISELIAAEEINNNDVIPVVQNGVTKKIKFRNLNKVAVGSSTPDANEQIWFRKGKNELDTTNLITQTFNGVTISRNSDGTITLNGTSIGSGTAILLGGINKLIKGTNTFSARIVSGTIVGGAIRISINDNTAPSATSTDARIFSTMLNENTSINSNTVENLNKTLFYLSIYINAGITFTNCKIAMQVEAGSTHSNYETYIDKTIQLKNKNGDFDIYADVSKLDMSYSLGLGEINIISGTDLNNVTKPGTYRSESVGISATLVNCPQKTAGFKMIIENLANSQLIRQTIYPNSTKSITYVRTYTGAWGGWKKLLNEEVIFDNTSGNTGNITLSKAISNFDEIDIFYAVADYYKSVKIPVNGTSIKTVLDCTYIGTSNMVIGSQDVTISGTSLTRGNSAGKNINLNTNEITNNTTLTFTIYKVIGY